jgi:SAM-dependent methyltransferase
VNERHLALCASPEWADAVARWILPSALAEVDLGARTVEFGPGPGVTTELLAALTDDLVAVEIDPELAARLAYRMADRPGVRVVRADAARSGLPDASADSVVCLTMLHHVPTVAHQDAIFTEARRLLVPGGVFAGCDSLDGPDFRELHESDTCNPIPPDTLEARLSAAGFSTVEVMFDEWGVRFRARTAKHDR